jgi:hypothetical protein
MSAVLAQLMAQTAAQGADLVALRAIAEEAGELGARRALARLGLEDAQAAKDMAELRELLGVWREAKKSLWKALLGWVGRMALVLMLAGLVVKLGFLKWAA